MGDNCGYLHALIIFQWYRIWSIHVLERQEEEEDAFTNGWN